MLRGISRFALLKPSSSSFILHPSRSSSFYLRNVGSRLVNLNESSLVYRNNQVRMYCSDKDKPDEEKDSEEEQPKEKEESKNTKIPLNVNKRAIQSRSRTQLSLYHPYPLISNDEIPAKVPFLALRKPILPGVTESCFISSDLAIKINKRRESGVCYVAGFLKKDYSDEKPVATLVTDPSTIHNIGFLATVDNITSGYSTGIGFNIQLVLTSLRRVEIDDVDVDDVQVPNQKRDLREFSILPVVEIEPDPDSVECRALNLEILGAINTLTEINPSVKKQFAAARVSLSNLSLLTDLVFGFGAATPDVIQATLEEVNVIQRAQQALVFLHKECQLHRLRQKINNDVYQSVNNINHRAHLLQRYNALKKELGFDKEEKELQQKRWDERIKERKIPEHALKVINEERERLSNSESLHSAEYTMQVNYLDTVTSLPWGLLSEDVFDIPHAESLLHRDHFGLKNVKQRILQFIAVAKLNLEYRSGKILCFIGPPGVGKTSIGKSIAEATGRKFVRFSVGGLSNASEIKGHRRTYIGALPGRVITSLKRAETSNPVLMIDEIDKLGRYSFNGDPSAALLEVLDPEQNNEFLDHYVDIPYDLSKVLFICTANDIGNIPLPLLDRMEVIEVPGYTTHEKQKIAEKYLIPRAAKDCGLADRSVQFSPEILKFIINRYCREPGVRNLQKTVETIFRELAMRVVTENLPATEPFEITEEFLNTSLGPPKHFLAEVFTDCPPGVAVGLSYSTQGGSILILESVAEPIESSRTGGSPTVKFTGSLGDVLKESAQIAITFTRLFLRKSDKNFDDISSTFFNQHDISLHLPSGAVPKDGPSAGIALTTTFMSLALRKQVDPRLGMTGEITLTGRVLPIGGVQEKSLGAQRSGLTRLIFPESNRPDWDELEYEIKQYFEKVYFVSRYDEVYDIVFNNGENFPESKIYRPPKTNDVDPSTQE